MKAWSAGGTRVFFQTAEQLVGSDTDSALDVYERSSGTTTLRVDGTGGRQRRLDALLQDVSDDGSRVVIGTAEGLVGSDTDGRIDLYERAGGTTTLLSTGPSGGNGNFDAFFSAASKDGGRVFFETGEQLSSDTDVFPDVYEREAGTTTRLSIGTGGGNGAQTAVFTGASEDGYRVWFASAEKLASTDTDAGTDIFEVRPTAAYPRPKGATPLKVALVSAYDPCTVAEPPPRAAHVRRRRPEPVVQPARAGVRHPHGRHARLERRAREVDRIRAPRNDRSAIRPLRRTRPT